VRFFPTYDAQSVTISETVLEHERGGPMQTPSPQDDVLLTAAQLKRRWGNCSDMLLWRRLRGDPEMPVPLRMCGRRFWYLSAILGYERRLLERSTPEAA
jgi:hypothetical protein